MKRTLFALLLLAFAGCAGTAHRTPAATAAVTTAPAPFCIPAVQATGPETAALAEIFFGVGPRVGDFDALLDAALARYPGAYELHEMAAWWYTILGDRSRAAHHYMIAACDLASPRTDIYLHIIRDTLSAGEKRQFVPVLAAIALKHPDPAIRAVSAAVWSDVLLDLGRVEEARAVAKAIGYIGDWAVIGSFDNDQGKGFYEVYPPEKEIDLTKRYKGKVGEIGWLPVMPVRHDGLLSLQNLLYPSSWSTAYLVTHAKVEAEIEARIVISTGSPTAVWLNGEPVYANDRIESFFYDTVTVPVRLAKGWNRILVKSAAENRGWLFAARLTDTTGAPLRGAVFSRNVADVALAAPVAQPAPSAPEEEVLPTIAQQNRHIFLQALADQRSGLWKKGRQELISLYEGNGHNPLALFFAAQAFMENDEEGRLIDLLNRAVSPQGMPTAGFLALRGDFYRRKGIRDSAEEDYKAARTMYPEAPAAYWGLAGLFRDRWWHKDRRDIVETMRQKWPDDVYIIREQADCAESLGYFAGSEKILQQALELEPGQTAILRKLATMARMRHDLPAALRWVGALARLAPDNPAYPAEQAELLRRMSRYDEAKKFLDHAAALAPSSPGAYQELGNLAWEQGRREEALAQWKKALDRNPKNSSLAERVTYLSVGEKDIAERYLPSEAEINARIAVAKAMTPHPAAQALIALDQAAVHINDDGSSIWYVTDVKLVVNDAGRDTLINESLPFMGRLKILKAYSLDPKGTRQEASSIRGGQIRFRQLDKGSVTVVQYIHYSPPPHFLDNHFLGQWYFQTVSMQMLYSELRLIHNPKRELVFDIRAPVAEWTETVEGLTMRTFTATNRPPLMIEPMAPPVSDFLDQMTISSIKGWEDYVNWERALLKNVFVSTKETRELATRLTAGKQTPRAKMDAIFRFVAQDIRYQQDYENTIAGVKPHSPAQVIERRYGDCKDKAVLFIQLAKEAGLKAEYAILRTRRAGQLQKKIPNQQFNHAIVHIPVQPGVEEAFFMDPTVDLLEIGNLREDDQGVESLVMDVDTAQWRFIPIPYQPSELNYERQDIALTVSPDGSVAARATLTLRGNTSSYVRQTLRTPKEADRFFQGLVNKLFQGGTLTGAEHGDIEDIERPLTITIKADASNLLLKQDDQKRLRIPLDILRADMIKLAERVLPMELGIPSLMEVTVSVSLPPKAKVLSAPEKFRSDGPCFSVERTAQGDAKALTVTTRYRKECTVLKPADYPAFRTAAQEVVSRQEDYIIFK